MEFKGLAIGRVVHYVAAPGEHRPAIVTRVKDKVHGIINLNVFRDAEDHGSLHPGESTRRVADVAHDGSADDACSTGTWHWPERED
jgi:hypothetical protein